MTVTNADREKKVYWICEQGNIGGPNKGASMELGDKSSWRELKRYGLWRWGNGHSKCCQPFGHPPL